LALMAWAGLPPSVKEKTMLTYTVLTSEAMDVAPQPSYKGLSNINASGLPFQWSFCFDGVTRSVRFLCEAGTPGEEPSQRFRFSIERLKSLTLQMGIPDPQWL